MQLRSAKVGLKITFVEMPHDELTITEVGEDYIEFENPKWHPLLNPTRVPRNELSDYKVL